MATSPYHDKKLLCSTYSRILGILSNSEEGTHLLEDLNNSSVRYVTATAKSTANEENRYCFEEYSQLKNSYTKIKEFLTSNKDYQDFSSLSEDRFFIEGLAGIVVSEAMKQRK
ncbi:MAG: hypothetical protein ABIA37_03325 [Candidatus Woesearchaeota archaeon]